MYITQVFTYIKGKGKGKAHRDGPKGEKRYSYTLSLTSALDEVGSQRHAPAALPPRKTQYPLLRRLCGALGRSGRARKISPPPGIDPLYMYIYMYYGLDGPRSNPGGDEISCPSRPALGPTQPPVKWVRGLSRG